MRRHLRICVFICVLVAAISPALAANYSLETGTLEGARFATAKPRNWNGRVLLLAPDSRGAGEPARANLRESSPLALALLEQGWLLATTSYRRSGLVIRDAIADLENLRLHLAQRHGQPKRVYVMGEIVGGAIAVRMMEHFEVGYDGALAVGAALNAQEAAPTIGLELTPRRHLLFLSSQSEFSGPRDYVGATQKARPTPPVAWVVAREGPANVNTAEKLAALDALVRWVEDAQQPEPNRDATVPPSLGASRIAFNESKTSGTGRVTSISGSQGRVVVEFRPADMETLGIVRGSWFSLEIHGKNLRVLYGFQPPGGKRERWMAYPEAEGGMMLAVDRGNTAAALAAKPGDAVTIRRISPASP